MIHATTQQTQVLSSEEMHRVNGGEWIPQSTVDSIVSFVNFVNSIDLSADYGCQHP